MRGRVRAAGAAASALALLLTACSSGSSPAPSTTVVPTTTSPPRFARGEPDGTLTIGVLLPLTGAGASLGEPLVNVVHAAVNAVNAAGGVNGRDVRVVDFDEGAGPSSAGVSVDDLLDDAAVDAVIGPASSRVALSVLPTITAAGVAACSPTATSMALTDMPDDGLFLRTVPSDALEALAIARVIDQTGAGAGGVALVYTDDVYGRPFAAAVGQALQARGIPVTSDVPYDPDDDDYSTDAAGLLADDVQVVALIGDAASGGRMVSALLEADPSGGPLVVTNDAVRDAQFGSRVDAAALADRVSGVSVSAYDGRQTLTDLLGSADLAGAAFAAAAVDCVNLLALGAAVAGPDDASGIVASAIGLTIGGVPCSTFADCRAWMDEDRKADYNGPSGGLQLDQTGEVTRANYEVFGFDRTGADVTSMTISISR